MIPPLVAGQAATDAAGTPCSLRTVVLPGDRDAVRALVERTGFFHSAEVEIATELVEEHLAQGPRCGYHFVLADLDNALAAYACYGPISCTTASFDLYWIAVDPRFQRRGIGRLLMSTVESRIAAAGGDRIYIDTSGRDQYASTRAFYECSGFRCEARLRDFYGPGDDRAIYVKALVERHG
jgi:ribosomal protein S18 acetylase RimI-like enzyme